MICKGKVNVPTFLVNPLIPLCQEEFRPSELASRSLSLATSSTGSKARPPIPERLSYNTNEAKRADCAFLPLDSAHSQMISLGDFSNRLSDLRRNGTSRGASMTNLNSTFDDHFVQDQDTETTKYMQTRVTKCRGESTSNPN